MKRAFSKIILKYSWLNGLLSSYQGFVLKNSFGFFLLQGVSIILGFFLNFLLIRTAGSENYGQYVYVFNFLAIVAGLCVAGTDTLVLQRNPVYIESRQQALLKGVIFFSTGLTFLVTLIAAFIALSFLGHFSYVSNLKWFNYYGIFFLALPAMSLLVLLQSSVRGFSKIFESQLAEKIIRPVALILVVVIFIALGKPITFPELIQSGIAAALIAFIVVLYVHKKLLTGAASDVRPAFAWQEWLKPAAVFFLLDGLALLNARIDIFILGILTDSKTVGDYNIVLKLSEINGFGLYTANLVISPIVAKLIYLKEKENLQKLITITAQLTLVFASITSVVLICFSKTILSFFGIHAGNSQTALIILCIGQFVNVLIGSVGVLLLLSGNQKSSVWSLFISILITISLDLFLIPLYNITGVAIASATGLIVWNGLMYYFVRKKLSIYTTAFSKL
ncbi:MAG: polysaccharide biosynthesis C-terminal domain-containing protein [Chitinophagaceae bacterium]